MSAVGPGRLSGTVALIWYTPTEPGANPAKLIRAGWPPIITSGVTPTMDSGSAGPGAPDATDGITTPKPVAQIVIASPGNTGFEDVIC